MADSANGSTFNWGGTVQTDVRSINFTENGNPIDVSVLGSAQHVYELGLVDTEIVVEAVGVSSIEVSTTTQAATATWNDGSTDSLSIALCTGKDVSGSLDTELITSLTFKPAL